MHKLLLVLLLTVFSTSAMAGMVLQATSATLQPLIERNEKGFFMCGVRGMVSDVTGNQLRLYDFSLHIRVDALFGMLKAGSHLTPIKSINKDSSSLTTAIPAPVKFWIAKEKVGKPITLSNIMPAISAGFIIGSAELVDTLEGIMAIIYGERMQFVIRYKAEPVDRVISFSAEMPKIELEPLTTCIEDVTSRMAKELKE